MVSAPATPAEPLAVAVTNTNDAVLAARRPLRDGR